MEALISPGALSIENDQSPVTQNPIQAGASLVGPTVKGKVNVPTLVNNYSEFVSTFGETFEDGNDQYTFFTSISAKNYFENGGGSLLVTRVATGSYTPAASSPVISGYGVAATASLSTSSFTLETLGEGEIMNSSSSLSPKGALASGSVNNLRWEIVNPNTSSGVFSVIIRRGDDTTKSKSILETFTNVSLDPKSPNYISRMIGDQTLTVVNSGSETYLQPTGSFPNVSKYVRVKSVNLKTPDYLNNDGTIKSQYTSSIPIAQSGSFTGATGAPVAGSNYYDSISNINTQGLKASDYSIAFNLLSNPDEFKYNLITAPGLVYANASHASVLNTLISNIEARGDALLVMDLENFNSSPTNAVSTAVGIDSSYVASYWPWLQVKDSSINQNVWVPASTMIPGVLAYSDKVSEVWFAPAGLSRGKMNTVIQAERKLTQSDRDKLYSGKVNSLATFPGKGVVVFGNKTLQSKASALDRINVRRLLIELKSYIGQVASNLVFEPNTKATRNNFLAQVNPYLDNVQQQQGLYAYKVVMDDTNNTSSVIDRNELVGAIYLQPTKTSEYIYLTFNINPTGVSYE